MIDDRSDERLKTQRRLAREYRKRGYSVIEQPRGDDLPPFLRQFSPDLIATGATTAPSSKSRQPRICEGRTRSSNWQRRLRPMQAGVSSWFPWV